jgi:hypothetical protein
MLTTCHHIKFHTATSNNSLVISIKSEAKGADLVAAMLSEIFGLFAKSQKASSYHLGFHCSDFREILYWEFFLNNLSRKLNFV